MSGELRKLIPALLETLGGEIVDLAEQGGGEPKKTQELTDSDYKAAIAVVKESGRASISLVQRHLRIGYNAAARLIERMEKDGIVSAPDASGNRTINTTAGE